MFCADRCAISSLGEAVDLALQFPAEAVGVVVDTYHVWWDAQLAAELARAAGRIVSYQLCDWILPLPPDVLLGRGHLGDGYIDFAAITALVLAAGYQGYAEVEIINAESGTRRRTRPRRRLGTGSPSCSGDILGGIETPRSAARRGTTPWTPGRLRSRRPGRVRPRPPPRRHSQGSRAAARRASPADVR